MIEYSSSNMSETSFLQRRGIRPIRSLVVHARGIQLAFNLPGVPYIEPRFANVIVLSDEEKEKCHWNPDREDGKPWGNGLVGVAYYITMKDMATIVMTEGGGSSYQVIQVDCEEILERGQTKTTGEKIRANTLCASDPARLRTQLGQPSPRYMRLLCTGARGTSFHHAFCNIITDMCTEKSLPEAYITYLDAIETYRRKGIAQTLGMITFILFLGPIFIVLLPLQRVFRNKDGQSPAWMQKAGNVIFRFAWKLHDYVARPLFGSGEVTKTD
jgi:hypothetical protein